MGTAAIDILWIVLSAALVFLMQAGFLCLETGLTRSKNNINVAMKSLADFGITTVMFWVIGYGLMFGVSESGILGTDSFLVDYEGQERLFAFLLFQVMFCGNAVTILSGAVAERMRFGSYLIAATIISAVIYPIFGHWAWNGIHIGETTGWLNDRGFVDFAGSSVVHSVGGWVSLAVLIIIGSRSGRFNSDGSPRTIPGANVPVATLGVFLLWFGWIGFNGGSTLGFGQDGEKADLVVRVITNTIVAGSFGMVATLLAGWPIRGRAETDLLMNGTLAGLVAITANAHSVSLTNAAIIGCIGGLFMLALDIALLRFKIDDAVGAVPVHLGAGIWGTLAVALFGEKDLLGTGLSQGEQLLIQLVGIVVCGVWTFGVTFFIMSLFNRFSPLRVSLESEKTGLNVSEHGATTELLDLFEAMNEQQRTGDLSLRVPVEPFTEVGQIAERYNRVMAALEGAIARTDTIVRSAMDAIVTFSKDTLAILSANPAAEAILGYGKNALHGQSIMQILGESSDSDLDNLLYEAALGTSHYELVGRRANGTIFPMEMALATASVNDEVFYTGIFRDISERKKYEDDLIDAKEAAEAANRAKSTFLANMSHELRTPLNAVIGYGDMLLSQIYGPLSDKQADRITRIIQNGKLLLEHINTVLDLSKIEAGRMEVYLEFFSLHSLLTNITNIVTPLVQRNSNQLITDFDEPLGAMYSDLQKVQQILLNLLSNASKFTDSGEIKLSCTRVSMKGQDWIEFKVTDSGIGMSQEQITHIFDAFTQADSSTTRKYGGTGLGLAICKRFSEMLGGDILVESQVGTGSTFTLIVPADSRKSLEVRTQVTQDITVFAPSGSNPVLVIDDDPAVRELMTHYLEQEGFQVRTASSGEEGLQLARELHPILITLDVMMPGMDGWTVLSTLKADNGLTHIPVVMLTIVDEKNTGFALGATDYLQKPVDRDVLVKVLRKYRCEQPPCPILVVEDEENTRQLIRDVLEAEGWTINEAENGLKGLQRLQENRPVLILLDLMMPEMDGFIFIETVRKMEKYRDIPIVVVTARDLSEEDRSWLNGGVQRVLQKGSYNRDDLMIEIRQLARQFIQ